MTGVEGAFEIVKAFLKGLLEYWWIIAIVLIGSCLTSTLKKK